MLEKGKISALQMAYMLYATIIGTSVLAMPGIMARYAQNDLWLSPIWASLIGIITVYTAFQLHKYYPKLTIMEYGESILGRILGKLLGFSYLIFYILMNGHGVRIYSDFIVGSFLPQTPIIVVASSMLALCAFAVLSGVETIGRASQLFVPFYVIAVFIVVLLMLPDLKPIHLLPMFSHGALPSIKGSVMPQGWFAEVFVISFLLPYLADASKGRKWGLIAVIAVMLTMVITNLAILFLFGPDTPNYTYPLLTASAYISYADFFENVESVIMAIWVMGNFIKFATVHYCLVLGTAQWLNLSDYRSLVWPIGLMTVLISFWNLPSQMHMTQYSSLTFPFYSMFFQTLIPLLLLLIAAVRKRMKKGVPTS